MPYGALSHFHDMQLMLALPITCTYIPGDLSMYMYSVGAIWLSSTKPQSEMHDAFLPLVQTTQWKHPA